MPLYAQQPTQAVAGRLICFGHSFVAPTFTPYGASFPWADSATSTDGSRYSDLLVNLLGVDISNRYLTVNIPSVAAASSLSVPLFVPEEGILEAAYLMPAGSLTGANTNTRSHAVTASIAGASIVNSFVQYNSGTNLAALQHSTLTDITTASLNPLVAYRDSTGLLARTLAMNSNMTVSGTLFPVASYFFFQSSAVGTGIADPGGQLLLRWGGSYRNLAIGGSRLVKSGVYHGGWAACLLGRPLRHVYGPEVNATPGESGGATSLRCDALEYPIPSGWVIPMSGGVTATVTADANVSATSVTVSALSGAVAAGEQGVAKTSTTGGYHTLTPLGLSVLGWGRNDATRPTPDRTGWKEALRASIALQSCPYYQSSDRANVVVAAGNGASAAWSSWAPGAGGQFINPWRVAGRAVRRFTGAVGATPPTIIIKLPPAYDGSPVDLFFVAQAGTSKGGAATVTASSAFNGGTACTINTTSACLNENLTTGPAGTVSGTTTLTLTSGTWTSGLVDQIGAAIKGTAGTGTIAAGTKIASITSSTVAVLDTAGTNGTVTAIETAGYVPMVKRLVGLTAGAGTVTVTLTGMDTTTGTAEFVFMGYGIESTPTTPVIVVGIAKAPTDSGDWTDVDNLNTDTQAVIAGTATNPNSGNSTEPALPTSVLFVDVDTPLGLGADLTYWEGDGIHPSGRGHVVHAATIARMVRRSFSTEQLAAR